MKNSNLLVISFWTLLLVISCSDDNAPTLLEETGATLPSNIVLKDIPAGTFSMGGTTVQNDAPVISITMSAFEISEKEITNQEYADFLNAAYAVDLTSRRRHQSTSTVSWARRYV